MRRCLSPANGNFGGRAIRIYGYSSNKEGLTILLLQRCLQNLPFNEIIQLGFSSMLILAGMKKTAAERIYGMDGTPIFMNKFTGDAG